MTTATLPDPRFWDRIAPKYSRQAISDTAAYTHKLALTQAILRPDMRVLEVGCGTGGTAREHAPHVASYLGTDLSPAMIAIAKERAGGAPNLSFEARPWEAVEGGPFDAILALNVLHLVADWEGAIARAHAMLPPGGAFVSSTLCLTEAAGWLRVVAPVAKAVKLFPPVLTLFTRDAVLEAHRAAGFTLETIWQPTPKKALFLIARKA
ncbi:MAG: class I SAM-dependent methyltransferase [Pseudomonadota bacterium]